MAERVECGAQPRLRMTGISKRFGVTPALDGVDLSVHEGEVHALVGENGAGKSTLMKVLSGAIQPDAGSITLDGRPFHPRGPLEARRAGVAMIYQELSLAPHLSVEDNIMLGAEPTQLGFVRRSVVRAEVSRAMEQFAHAGISPTAKVGSLSPAEQQLVEIARAIAVGCRVLVLDEPTSSLTSRDVERLFDLIARLRDTGHSIVYISHLIEEVRRVADRVTVLRDGSVAGSGDVGDLSIADIVSLMVGREIADLYPRSPREPGETVLEADKLAGARQPVEASFSLRRGEVLGIAGLVGAGRTELVRTIFGLDPVRSGQVTVGLYSGPASPMKRWGQGVGMLSEDRKSEGLAVGLSITDNVTASRLDGFGPAGLVLPRLQDRATRRWVDALGIRCTSTRQRVNSLSGGNQQKVALARLLQHDVDVLLLDEPTRGIDVASKAQIYQLIDRLACGRLADGTSSGRQRAVLMVSSYLPELLGVCDRIAVMCRGVLGPAKPVSQLDEKQIMLEATGQELPL